MPALTKPAILLDVPAEIETERLILRPPRPGDSVFYQEAAAESVDELSPWFEWAHPLQSIEKTEIFLRESSARIILKNMLLWLIWRKEDQQFLGSTTLHALNWSTPELEIGYWLRTSATGQGYMTEVVNALVNYSFEHLHMDRLQIFCDQRNAASARVAERAGFTLEAVIRHSHRDVEGQLRDDLCYVMLRPD